MLILMLVVFVASSHIACCHGSNGGPINRPSPDLDLYGELLTRLQRLEQRDQQQAEKITALESKMAAMAAVIDEQQREIETLKQSATEDPGTNQVTDQADNYDDKENDGNARSNLDKQEGATRHLPSNGNVRQIKKRAAFDGKVAFFARADVSLKDHLGINQNVIFEKVVVNFGNAYNPHHGVFTAPVSGTYLFSSSIMSYVNREVQAHIALNGNPVARIWARGTDGRHDQGSQTIVLTLRQGDDVSVQNELNDDALWGLEYCSFSGVLLWVTSSETVIVG